ncbi:outer membrane lipoprotein carrier protein LolA [Flavihumibacter fluvii]|uniref:outer membrane lipoprotein carrier protein LolA n=1 Tax=Flavihumibacter fluvii TaxID=2838157 RepID=UPI001BDE3E36|nr:outer membrane lipoprotein carrier protein LolA [Flavihumibacter fluvii]ULQ51468.1 outer membrane lipoprotein carrier protein LolA [Flavihumibacter fluvii]
MRKLLLILYFLLLQLVLTAQPKGFRPVANMDAFRTSFTAAAQQVNSIKSDFIQEKNLSMLSEKIISKGKFWFRKENMVRMEYQQPFQYLMIMNGNNVYIKDGQQENRMSVKSNKLFQKINKITVDCIKGTILDNKDFTVAAFENQQQYLLEMTPVSKNLSEFFSRIQVTIDRKDYSVTKINMIESGGDNTMISFIQKELNTTISDAVFSIK